MQVIEEKTAAQLYAVLAPRIAKSIAAALASQGTCVLGIVGGRSMPALLEQLHGLLARSAHGSLHIFWLDERIDSDKNFISVLPVLERFSRLPLKVSWHPLVSVQQEAMEQEMRVCEKRLALVHGELRFDVIIMSAGEDGHVCSLFPHHPALRSLHRGYVIVDGAPKPPPLRVSVSRPLLQSAATGFLLFVGDKRTAYERFLDLQASVYDCPAKIAQGVHDLTVGVALE